MGRLFQRTKDLVNVGTPFHFADFLLLAAERLPFGDREGLASGPGAT